MRQQADLSQSQPQWMPYLLEQKNLKTKDKQKGNCYFSNSLLLGYKGCLLLEYRKYVPSNHGSGVMASYKLLICF
jgi:hypothetical protein